MRARLGRALIAGGVLVAASGCTIPIVAAPTLLGRDQAPTYAARTQRETVDGVLGAPVATTALPDGGVVATYRYRQRVRQVNETSGGVVAVELASLQIHPYVWLVLQPLLIPTAIGSAIYTAATPTYATVTFTFGPQADLLHEGKPPGFGAPDEAVAAPTVGALRRTCWAGPQSHVDCVLLRFAVWAVE
jgi:hypothetical protein